MSVAVCVPYRPRNDHDAKLWDWARRRWEALFPDWPVHVADSGHEPFNRSASRNDAAAMCPDAQVLVFANSDTVPLHADEMTTAVDSARAGAYVLPDLYVETNDRYATAALASDPAGEMADPLSAYERQLRNSPAGPQIMSRELFELVGGWDAGFIGWGWEDSAMRSVVEVLSPGGLVLYQGTAVHLWHPRSRAEWPQSNRANKVRKMRLYDTAARQGPRAMRAMLRKRGL